MSKERLEEIKNNKTYLGGTNGLIIAINTDDYDWLIEQVEQKQIYDRHNYGLMKANDKLQQQNKRYRKSIKKLKQMVNDSEVDCGMICDEIREMEVEKT